MAPQSGWRRSGPPARSTSSRRTGSVGMMKMVMMVGYTANFRNRGHRAKKDRICEFLYEKDRPHQGGLRNEGKGRRLNAAPLQTFGSGHGLQDFSQVFFQNTRHVGLDVFAGRSVHCRDDDLEFLRKVRGHRDRDWYLLLGLLCLLNFPALLRRGSRLGCGVCRFTWGFLPDFWVCHAWSTTDPFRFDPWSKQICRVPRGV